MDDVLDLNGGRQLTPQEVKELIFDIRIKKVAEDGIKRLFDMFQEYKWSPAAQTRENYSVGLSNLFSHLFHGGESGIGAMNLIHQTLLELRDKTTEDMYIVDEMIISYEKMRPRWEKWFVGGGELDYS